MSTNILGHVWCFELTCDLDATDPVAPPGPTDLRAEMDQMLKDKGYDDPDAREEILDEIAKEGGTPEAQKANLGKKYTDRSEATRKKENKKQGDKRRAKKAGGEVPAGTPLGAFHRQFGKQEEADIAQGATSCHLTSRSSRILKRLDGRIPTPASTCSNRSRRAKTTRRRWTGSKSTPRREERRRRISRNMETGGERRIRARARHCLRPTRRSTMISRSADTRRKLDLI